MKEKIRFALAIDHRGEWSVCGWKGAILDEMMANVVDTLEPGERRYWVDVEVERPEGVADTVQATAIPA